MKENSSTNIRAKTIDEPEKLHRREMVTQIWLPLFGAIVVGLLLVILALVTVLTPTAAANDATHTWGGISFILLAMPALMAGLLIVATVGALVYLFYRLIPLVPAKAHQVHLFFLNIELFVKVASNKVTEPFLKIQQGIAGWRAFWQQIFHH